MAVRCLSFHAVYRCHESGACCTSGWPIAIEPDRLASAERAMAVGHLQIAVPTTVAFVRPSHSTLPDPAFSSSASPTPPTFLATVDGACVFHRPQGRGRCALHGAMGHTALPLACRQFPRVSVLDPRGVSVTLSHYCPTAASLLADPGEVTIVVDTDPFPADGEYEGLDARTSLPPLLRPGLLMDWEAWWAWEARSVALIAAARTSSHALAALGTAVERVRTWKPGGEPLVQRVNAAFESLGDQDVLPPRVTSDFRAARLREVMASIPRDLRPDEGWGKRKAPEAFVRRNFLLAHAFGNWTGYVGQGLRTWLRSLEAVDALLDSGADVSTVDLLLRHLADPFVLADHWSEAERHGGPQT